LRSRLWSQRLRRERANASKETAVGKTCGGASPTG